MIFELNGFHVILFVIGNADMNADTEEKLYLISGTDFVPEAEGVIAVVVKALYGLK